MILNNLKSVLEFSDFIKLSLSLYFKVIYFFTIEIVVTIKIFLLLIFLNRLRFLILDLNNY